MRPMQSLIIVEDDKLLGQSMRDILEAEGYEATWVKSATELFARLEERPAALIYLDIMILGDIDGYEVLRRLKSEGSLHRDTPVIMVSNFGQVSEIEKAKELGATDYLVKANIDLSQLVEITASHIGKPEEGCEY
jgi:CheY-like chemotaxis protein